MVGMAFVRILVRDHTDGGTGETRMGMEGERRDPVRAAQHRACTVVRRRPRCSRELATRDSVRLAETVFASGEVAPSWTIEEGARMAAVRARHIFR